MKEDSSKDLLEKNKATKMTSIQESEQGTYYQKIHFMANFNIFLIHVLFEFMLYAGTISIHLLTYVDQIGNPLKVPNPLYVDTSLPKEDLSKDLLKKKETTKIISTQEPEQGKII